MLALNVNSDAHMWAVTLQELSLTLPKATYNNLFAQCQFISREGDAYVIGFPNESALEWVNGRQLDNINRTLRAMSQNRQAYVVTQLISAQPASTEPDPPEPPPPPTDPSPTAPDTAVNDNGNGRHGVNGLPPTPPPAYTEEEWQIVHQVVSDHKNRQEGKRKPGRPHNLTTGNGSVRIQAAERDPMYSFCATPHYASRFWRPFLGLLPFSLWEVLRSYYELDVRYLNGSMPSISQLAATLGITDRTVLLGRQGREVRRSNGRVQTYPDYTGAIDTLAQWGILTHVVEGEGANRVHALLDLELKLPLLAPTQVATLDPLLQQAHSEFIARYGVTAESWLQEVAAAHVHRKAGVTK